MRSRDAQRAGRRSVRSAKRPHLDATGLIAAAAPHCFRPIGLHWMTAFTLRAPGGSSLLVALRRRTTTFRSPGADASSRRSDR